MSLIRRRAGMLLICIAALILLIIAVQAKEDSEDEVTFSDFTLYSGDSINVGDYRAELVEIQSVRDGIVVMRVTKTGGALDEQRALLQNNANNFDGGSEEGGLTITVMDIFDEQSAKVRAEYKESLGNAHKRTSDRPKTSGDLPALVIKKSFDKDVLSVGDDAQVTVDVKNVGTGPASSIALEDLPPLPEFSYVAGYPPKIKENLDAGESDSAVYVIKAVHEGSIRVPAITIRYQDSKKNAKSNTSEPFNVQINPKDKPDLDIRLSTPAPLTEGGKGSLNVSVTNIGKAAAVIVEIKPEIQPSDGLEAVGLEKTYSKIPPGGEEAYSAELTGRKAGNYTITIKASFEDEDETIFRESTAEVAVMAREYKYLYYLLVLPVIAMAVWIYRRYREYKY